MDQATRSALEASRDEILSDWDTGQEIVGVDTVDDPRPGLILQLRRWLIPPGTVLDVRVGPTKPDCLTSWTTSLDTRPLRSSSCSTS
jgi:hypothetical protein